MRRRRDRYSDLLVLAHFHRRDAQHMSSSRKSAIAGTVAGLLVAGIGAWYATHHKINAAVLPVVAASPALAPAAKANVSRDQAVEKLMALPELKRLADAIEKRSGG